jgi:ATP-dependent helicase Lhr and Lhr-like helicase
MVLPGFHPVIARWFEGRFGAPTVPQARGWPEIAAGRDTLIAAPTGSGKTLAAFLWCLDDLVKRRLGGEARSGTSVLYVSPLKALSNDVSKNLAEPLREIGEAASKEGLSLPEIKVAVRTGDTDTKARAKMAKAPPDVLVTTPESLFILLTSKSGRAALSTVRAVIVDEIHAVADDKRGAHLSLSLERLDEIAGRPQRIGLSATQKPIELIGRLLVGSGRPSPSIVDAGFARNLDLAIEVPNDELGAVASHEMMEEVYDRIAELSRAHKSTLVFVNTRRLVERVSHALGERLGEDRVAAHHGSLSRQTREKAEKRLKAGELSCVVATASLELGIDVGAVDLVVQIGSPRNVATFLQRVGRSGHSLGATPKGRLFSMTRDQLVECAALVRAVRAGVLDAIEVPEAPLDVLAQQIVAIAAAEEVSEERLFDLVRRAWPYQGLARDRFDQVIEMLSEGIAPAKGRARAYLHRDRVHGVLRARRGASLTAMTSGGAIPDNADYQVLADPEGSFVGTVDEDFAIESMAGDIFLLGNTSWRIRRVEAGRVRVEDAKGAPPTVPFWRGEAPARTRELSEQVSLLREEVEARLLAGEPDRAIAEHVASTASVPLPGAEQLVTYLAASRAVLGALPTSRRVVAERFFDESGGMQLIIHSPLGGRINKAWGLALRKRFCTQFDFELQAAATDDAIIISLGPVHSFPLAEVFEFLSAKTATEVLTQAVLQSPIFTARWRWAAQRSLAVPRHNGKKRVPPPIMRMRTDDLLAGVFPMAAACQDNVQGPIVVPDHPLVQEAMRDSMEEALDLRGFLGFLEDLTAGRVEHVSKDVVEPSLLAHEVINANPYAFLDGAPLEERRARAVSLRRGLPAEIAADLGALDPEAIETIDGEVRPDLSETEELHDALLSLGVLPIEEATGSAAIIEGLVAQERVLRAESRGRTFWIARERMGLVRAAYEEACFVPDSAPLASEIVPSPEDARKQIVRGQMETSGPRTASELAERLGLRTDEVDFALLSLEAEGAVLRGKFRPGAKDLEWCDRRILARIHRLTLGRLRREIEPVAPAELMRFFLRWQHVATTARASRSQGILHVVRRLEGLEIPAAAWEDEILARRIERYDPSLLDAACLGGEVVWGRLTVRDAGDGCVLSRATPIALVLRESIGELLVPSDHEPKLTAVARRVRDVIAERGPSFLRDLSLATNEPRSEVEIALRELAFAGLVTSDGFEGLRALIAPSHEGTARSGGRWSLLRAGWKPSEPNLEKIARRLLSRWGVLFRDLLTREGHAPPWRELLPILRRLEARGELRGGRFVAGFVGEQFALPEALESLRAIRKLKDDEPVVISSYDPLNLAGLLSPGPRVPASARSTIVLKDGVPLASSEPRPVFSGQRAVS